MQSIHIGKKSMIVAPGLPTDMDNTTACSIIAMSLSSEDLISWPYVIFAIIPATSLLERTISVLICYLWSSVPVYIMLQLVRLCIYNVSVENLQLIFEDGTEGTKSLIPKEF